MRRLGVSLWWFVSCLHHSTAQNSGLLPSPFPVYRFYSYTLNLHPTFLARAVCVLLDLPAIWLEKSTSWFSELVAASSYLCLLDHSIFLKGMPSYQTARNTFHLLRQRIKIAMLKRLQMKGSENFLDKWRFTVWLCLKCNNVNNVWPKALWVLWPSSINRAIQAVSLSQYDLQRCSKGMFFPPAKQALTAELQVLLLCVLLHSRDNRNYH